MPVRGTTSDAVRMNTSAFCELALVVAQTRESGAHEEERWGWGHVWGRWGRYQHDGVCILERGGYETDFPGGEWARRRHSRRGSGWVVVELCGLKGKI